MDQQPILKRYGNVLAPFKNFLLVIASITLAVMMFMTALDVALRYIFSSPISGGLELIEYMMAIMVPFAVTVTAFEKAHVGVDLLMERFPMKVQAFVACITSGLLLVFFALTTWQCFFHIKEQYHSGLTSAVLLIPHYPFVASLTAAFALWTLITLLHFIENITEVLS